MLDEFYPLGAWFEGATYWDYMMSHFAYLSDTIDNCFGTDFNLLSAPGLGNTVEFSVYSAGFAGTDNFYDAEFLRGESAATHATHYTDKNKNRNKKRMAPAAVVEGDRLKLRLNRARL